MFAKITQNNGNFHVFFYVTFYVFNFLISVYFIVGLEKNCFEVPMLFIIEYTYWFLDVYILFSIRGFLQPTLDSSLLFSPQVENVSLRPNYSGLILVLVFRCFPIIISISLVASFESSSSAFLYHLTMHTINRQQNFFPGCISVSIKKIFLYIISRVNQMFFVYLPFSEFNNSYDI